MTDLSPVTVLIVGEASWQEISLAEGLVLPDYSVTLEMVSGVKDAINILVNKKIDLILVDTALRDGTPITLLEALAHMTVRMVPTVVLVEYLEEDAGFEFFRKGAKDLIVKDRKGEYLHRVPVILERVLNEENRHKESSRVKKNAEVILSTISDGVIGFDLKGTVTFANPVAAMYLNQEFEKMIGKPITALLDGMDKEFKIALRKAMEEVSNTNHLVVVGQCYVSLAQRHLPILIKINLSPVFSEFMHLEGYVLFFKDVGEAKYPTGKMQHMMSQDDLTGLLNRKAILHRLEHAISYCKRYKTSCALLHIDLDGFKAINDIIGHHYGDELLLKVSTRINAVIRDADALARVGGDEFVVLLTHINHDIDAARVAVKINQALIPPFELNSQPYYISASIGIALFPNDSEEPEKLLQQADLAMGIAKKRGKNNYQFYKVDLNVEAEKNIRIVNDLRLALNANHLDLYFQPLLETKTLQVVGVEALIRWNHPEFGLLLPGMFIHLAEETGLITVVGRAVLKKACEYCRKWKEKGLTSFYIAVNVSIKELQQENFVDNVIECFAEEEVEPSRFVFEITESIFANDPDVLIEKLHTIKSLGVRIAMDDFGTGYSSLSYLKNLPVDIIKIDRSFIQYLGIGENQRHGEVISIIVQLAKRLNMQTLGEGVETPEQMNFLKEIGCEYLQGFLFSHPLPEKEILAYLEERLLKR